MIGRAILEKLKRHAKHITKKIMEVPWPVWPILFLLLLIFQDKMGATLRNLPPLQYSLLILTVLIAIIGIIRIQSKPN